MVTKEVSSKGGINRAKALSAEERKAIASNAAKERWEHEKTLPKATHKGEITIGDIVIPCAVLENGTRVLSESGIANAFGGSGSRSGAARRKKIKDMENGGSPLPIFMNAMRLEPFVSLVFGVGPIPLIQYKDGRGVSAGYAANMLPKTCEVWLKARDAGALLKQQQARAVQADILMRGLAHIGIVALVDEATGYQEERDKDALHKLLEVYLTEERLTWAKRFPDEFYKQIYRLRGWKYPSSKGQTPRYVGKLTNQLVYDRLPEGVLEELRHRNPTKEGTGRRKWKHHQFLSEDIGQADLRDHLLQLVAIMRISKSWSIFVANFEAAFPKKGDQIGLEFNEI
ncbi:MAG: P63C domain-containing protein [Ghiorsea sp.]